MRRNKKNKIPLMTDIPLTPLIDTALTLLVIFMVIAPSVRYGVHVSLPATQINQKGVQKEEISVSIDKLGRYYWKDIIVDAKQLEKNIVQAMTHTKQKTVFIKADKGVVYQVILDLFELLTKIPGIEDVVLPTEKRA